MGEVEEMVVVGWVGEVEEKVGKDWVQGELQRGHEENGEEREELVGRLSILGFPPNPESRPSLLTSQRCCLYSVAGHTWAYTK